MAIQRQHTSKRMSELVVHNGIVYLSGQVGDLPNGELADGIEAQVSATLANIARLLREAGTDQFRLLTVTIYLKDIDAHFEAMNAIWDAWLPLGVAPARATVEAKMCHPDILVEMSVTAAHY